MFKNKNEMKKGIIGLMFITLMSANITGCGSNINTNSSVVEEDAVVTEMRERGLIFSISQSMLDQGVELEPYNENLDGYQIASIYYYYRPVTDKLFDRMMNKNEVERKAYEEEFYNQMGIHSKCLMNIVLVEEKEYKDSVSKENLDDFTGFNNTEEYGKNDGYVYLISIPDLDTDGMSGEEKAQYEECKVYMKTVKQNLKFEKIEMEQTDTALPSVMPAFETKDLQGNTVTNDIFSQKDLTVVNVWGTFCSPCIEEMPELGKWAKEMPDNVQIIGLIQDVADENDAKYLDLANQIVKKAGAGYTQLIAGGNNFSDLMSGIIGVPTTFFVDKNGNIVGEPIVGADVEGYKQFVEDYFNGQ